MPIAAFRQTEPELDMSTNKERPQTPAQESEVADILDREYHEIGIAAVAAACRYLHEPEPAAADRDKAAKPH
jgi:hypothetical protein